MSFFDKVLDLSDEVAGRYAARDDARAETYKRMETGNILDTNDELVRKRLERLHIDPDTLEPIFPLPEEGAKGFIAAPLVEIGDKERIMGINDLISVSFLEKGWLAARAVGRINISTGLGFGTGFMISPRLMLTNNHVLPDSKTAARSLVEFDYQFGADGSYMRAQEFGFVPEEFFLTSVDLDFTLVAVQPINLRGQGVMDFGWLPLDADEGKVIKGEKLNIIQHPGGERKQIALRENLLEDILESFLHYQTDTAPGSSGAPVFNDQWEVVALHHAGVPKKDDKGNYLTLSGDVWDQSMPQSQLAWLANEGVRISRIVDFVNAQELAEPAAALWDAARSGELPRLNRIPLPQAEPAQGTVLQSTRAPVIAAPQHDIPEALTASFEELSQFNDRPYYDSVQDEQDRQAYYGSMAPVAETETAFDLTTADGWRITVAMQRHDEGADGAATPTFDQLHALLESTHQNRLSYQPNLHVYPWVDLHPDGKLRSIYSGKTYDPADFINEDFVIEQQRAKQFEAFRARESTALPETVMAGLEALLESQLPYNCEHVVPQSWFDYNEPMRGDLHHLFACESGCNSFRANIPYYDFEDFGEATRSECGKRVGNKFEPDAGKGAISRAVFYFLVRYPGLVENNPDEFEAIRLPFLMAWHNRYPVSDYERHRNMAIFARQGNRNPFIDFPQWANHIDFTKGLR